MKRYLYAVIFIPTLVYIITICPSIYWRDSPEFIDVGYTMGIGHPSGFPLYSILAKLFTFLPLGTIAFRINLLSSIASILSSTFLFILLSNILLKDSSRLGTPSLVYVISACTSILFAFTTSVWANSLVAEVYTIHSLFLILIIFLLIQQEIYGNKYMYIASFLYGLSSGNHGTVIFFLPGLLIFFLLVNDKKYIKRIITIVLLVLLGFSIYTYLPLRSQKDPPIDWGDTETLSNFIYHVTDRKDKAVHFTIIKKERKEFLNIIKDYITILNTQITPIGILLGIIGLGVNIKYNIRLFLLLFPILLLNSIFFIDWSSGDGFFPTYVVLMIWIGHGGIFILKKTTNLSINITHKIDINRLALIVFILFIIFAVVKNFNRNNRGDSYLGRDLIKNPYIHLPPKTILLSGRLWFHFRYLQDIEGLRKDITIISLGEIINPKDFKTISQESFPLVKIPSFTYSLQPADKEKIEYIKRLLEENKDIPVYMEADKDYSEPFYGLAIPEKKLFFKLSLQDIALTPYEANHYNNLLISELQQDIKDETFFYEQEIGEWYIPHLFAVGRYYMYHNYYNLALSYFQLLSKWFPNTGGRSDENILNLGICLAKLGMHKEAENNFNLLINGDLKSLAYYNLGILYFNRGNIFKAKELFVISRNIDPYFPDPYKALAVIYEGEKEAMQASKMWQQYNSLITNNKD